MAKDEKFCISRALLADFNFDPRLHCQFLYISRRLRYFVEYLKLRASYFQLQFWTFGSLWRSERILFKSCNIVIVIGASLVKIVNICYWTKFFVNTYYGRFLGVGWKFCCKILKCYISLWSPLFWYKKFQNSSSGKSPFYVRIFYI